MTQIPFVDIHTHPFKHDADTVSVQNIFPGDGFAAFTGRNFYSVGLHPWHIGDKQENNEALKMVEEALEFGHVIFVGEVGLDKIIDNDFAEQQRVFEAQAYMAEENRLPLVVHCVKAFNEVLELRKKMNPAMPWIMHGFNGSVEVAEQMNKMGFMFSFGANLFRENAKAAAAFIALPIEKIFFETDEMENRVEKIYEQGAMLKGITIEELKSSIWKNFNRIEKTLS